MARIDSEQFVNDFNELVDILFFFCPIPERDQLILRLRYLMGHNFREIGEKIGVSRSRANQLTEAAFRRLKRNREYANAYEDEYTRMADRVAALQGAGEYIDGP